MKYMAELTTGLDWLYLAAFKKLRVHSLIPLRRFLAMLRQPISSTLCNIMKYDHLKNIAVKDRPKKLTTDWNKEYFRGRSLLSISLLIGLCILNNFLAIINGKALLAGVVCFSIGIAAALLFHVSIFSGFISTNTGSYFKETEPIRFWINTIILVIM